MILTYFIVLALIFVCSIIYLNYIDYRIDISTWNGYSQNNVIVGNILLSLMVFLLLLTTKQKFPFVVSIFTLNTQTADCMGNCNPTDSKKSSPGFNTDDAVQNNRINHVLLSSSYLDTIPNAVNAVNLDRDASTLITAGVLGAASTLIPSSPASPVQGAIMGLMTGALKVSNDHIQERHKERVNRVSKNKNDEESKDDE